MPHHCEIKDQTEQPMLAMRARTSVQQLPETLGKAFGAVMQCLGEVGEHPVGAPFVVYYNMNMEDLDIEAGFPVSRALPGKGDVQPGQLPCGKVATCLHVGPYSEMVAAYEALTQFMKDNGQEPTGVCYEVYLNEPTQTPPQELMTQIVFPLKSV
jgi:effector-binding domain-containing protein